MKFSILNTTINKVISRSNVRPVGEPTPPNLKIGSLTASEVVTYLHPPSDYLEDNEQDTDVSEDEPFNAFPSSPKHKMPILDPNDLVGRTYLISKEDGQRIRARIIKAVDNYDGKLQ